MHAGEEEFLPPILHYAGGTIQSKQLYGFSPSVRSFVRAFCALRQSPQNMLVHQQDSAPKARRRPSQPKWSKIAHRNRFSKFKLICLQTGECQIFRLQTKEIITIIFCHFDGEHDTSLENICICYKWQFVKKKPKTEKLHSLH